MDIKCTDDIVIVCDFDGTISIEDVNTSIFRHFGNESTDAIENKYRNSMIGLRESLESQYEIIEIDEEAFIDYVSVNMELDESFFELCDFARSRDIKVVIVSGGFINYMEVLFKKYSRELDIPVVSNKLVIKNGIMVPQYESVPHCKKHYGPCGLCKQQHIMEYKKNNKVIYVGDGFTDRCAAENADIVFAKDNLVKYCRENNIKYIEFNRFKEIKDYIEENILK